MYSHRRGRQQKGLRPPEGGHAGKGLNPGSPTRLHRPKPGVGRAATALSPSAVNRRTAAPGMRNACHGLTSLLVHPHYWADEDRHSSAQTLHYSALHPWRESCETSCSQSGRYREPWRAYARLGPRESQGGGPTNIGPHRQSPSRDGERNSPERYGHGPGNLPGGRSFT